ELSILQNYITPGETKEVPIYYNNTYEENITVTIKIFDLRGNFIKEYDPITLEPGITKIAEWYLKNKNEQEVAPGIYIIASEDSKGNKARNMVIFVK
ncbi:MAG: hypothetical protein JW827_05395, partial [Spirochaetes bacterium]|nr:hypothetical protein [Spirochaetota bacterium]